MLDFSNATTILAHNRTLTCDTRVSGLNNNMLVIGPSGSGKTRHVLKPNLLQMGSNFIVLDTKGTLCREVGPVLAAHGYIVQSLDLVHIDCTDGAAPAEHVHPVGYNPLAQIRRDRRTGRPSQQDIHTIAHALCPIEDDKQPFWDKAASNLLACLISYVVEQLPQDERDLASVIKLVEHLSDGATQRLLNDLMTVDPTSYALSLWRRYSITQTAEKMNASIIGILAEKLMALGLDGIVELYRAPDQVDFERIGSKPTALFVCMNDIDRSLDTLAGLFVSQAFQALMRIADAGPYGCLGAPVRFMLDDFANLQIPNIDSILSVARSRKIWVTLLLQSVNQLEALYGRPRALSIMGNCDTHLVLAFQDIESARCYAERANRLPSTLFTSPLSSSWLFVRGRTAEEVRRYDLAEHPLYGELPEARPEPDEFEQFCALSAAETIEFGGDEFAEEDLELFGCPADAA